jgi:hypothetical protein
VDEIERLYKPELDGAVKDRRSDVAIKKDKLYDLCLAWRREYKPSCPESLQQVDKVNLACPDLVEDIFNLIGYEPYNE